MSEDLFGFPSFALFPDETFALVLLVSVRKPLKNPSSLPFYALFSILPDRFLTIDLQREFVDII